MAKEIRPCCQGRRVLSDSVGDCVVVRKVRLFDSRIKSGVGLQKDPTSFDVCFATQTEKYPWPASFNALNTSTVGMGLLVGKLALAISPKLQRTDYEKDECWPIRCVQKYCSRDFLIPSR